MKKMTLIIDIAFLGDIILSTLYILKTKSNFTVFYCGFVMSRLKWWHCTLIYSNKTIFISAFETFTPKM